MSKSPHKKFKRDEKSPTLKVLSDKIRKVREAKGFTQEGAANQIGFARSYYAGVENSVRNISAENLMRIAIAFDVEVGELFPPLKTIKREYRKRNDQ